MLMMMGFTGTNGIEKGWAPDEKRINRCCEGRNACVRDPPPLAVPDIQCAQMKRRAQDMIIQIALCRLVFIGRNLDAEELNASFRDCLVNNLTVSG
jgi:Cobalamin synthesis protein cobW C-terminal domain